MERKCLIMLSPEKILQTGLGFWGSKTLLSAIEMDTGADCMAWMKEAGFLATRVEPLVGPDSMVVGI